MIDLVVDAVTASGGGDRVHALLAQARHVVETVQAGDALPVDRAHVQQTHDELFSS
jgi:hypothetical protein